MEQSTQNPQTRTLQRPTAGRSIAGVAAAFADYLNVPVGYVRLAFVVGAFFGGIGCVAYVAGWVLIREEDSDESLFEHWLANGRSLSSWVGLGLGAVAILILLPSLDAFSGTGVVAIGLIVLGVLAYRGAFHGGLAGLNRQTGDGTDDRGDAPSDNPADDDDVDRSEALSTPSLADSDDLPPTSATITIPPRPRKRRRRRSRLARLTLAALLIVVGSMAVVDTADLGAYTLVEYLAVALLVIGGGLVVGALFGRAYSLVFLGLLLVAAIQITSWFDVPLAGGFGDPRFQAATAAEVESEYRLVAGQLQLDFGSLDLEGEVFTEVSVGAGELLIVLPDDVNVRVESRVVAGDYSIPGGLSRTGTDISGVFEHTPEGATGMVSIDASVGFGQIDLRFENR